MKYCPNCRREFPQEYRVCPLCAGNLAHVNHHVCPHCGRELPQNDLETCPYCLSALFFPEAQEKRVREDELRLKKANEEALQRLQEKPVETPIDPNWFRRLAHLLIWALLAFLVAFSFLPIAWFSQSGNIYHTSMFGSLLTESKLIRAIIKGTASFTVKGYYGLDFTMAVLFFWNVLKALGLVIIALSQAKHKDEKDCRKDGILNTFLGIFGIAHGFLILTFICQGPSHFLGDVNLTDRSIANAIVYLGVIGGISLFLMVFGALSIKTYYTTVRQNEVGAYHHRKHFGQGLITFALWILIVGGASFTGYELYRLQGQTETPVRLELGGNIQDTSAE